MSHKNVHMYLASALAAAGTFTIAYPDGTNAGTFRGAVSHLIATGTNDKYYSPANFTLSFGAASITATSVDMVLASDTELYVQLDVPGEDDGVPTPDRTITNAIPLTPMVLNLGAPDVADANGYIASQDLTAAGVFSVDTTVAAALAAAALAGTADVARNVVAAWTTAAVLTVTGTDIDGNVLVESSASGTSMTGLKAFKTVTNVSASVDITGLTVGTGDVIGLPIFVSEAQNVVAEIQDGVLLSKNSEKIVLPFFINQTDLLAGTAQQIDAPCAGYITELHDVVQTAVTTGGAITVEIDTVTVVGLSTTVADADAAGVNHSDTIAKIATGLVAKGDAISVTPAAAFATAGSVNGAVILEPLNVLNGTLVVGSSAAPTATTGDTRGTYDPAAACDGSLSFDLVVMVPDPAYRGLTPFAG